MDRKFIVVFCLCWQIFFVHSHPTTSNKTDPDEYNLSSSEENEDYAATSLDDETIHTNVKRYSNETDVLEAENDEGDEVVAETSTISVDDEAEEITTVLDDDQQEEVHEEGETTTTSDDNQEESVDEVVETTSSPDDDQQDEEVAETTTSTVDEPQQSDDEPQQSDDEPQQSDDEPQQSDDEPSIQRSLGNVETHQDLTQDTSDDNLHISYFPEAVSPGPFVPQVRIVGGTKVTNRAEFAYQASLRYASNSHFCGASIIDETTLITAAHCVFDNNHRLFPATRLLIVVGDLNVADQTTNTVVRKVQKITPHPEYDYKSFKNDIAILKVESLGEFTPYINKIDLANETPVVGTNCVVSGWGKTTFNGMASLQLMKVTVPILSRDDCMKGYGDAILDGMLCAGLMEGGKDACQGDSGGPLVCNNQLAGVVSWGYDCALKRYPGVYTDVAEYFVWIREQQGITTESGGTEPRIKDQYTVEKRDALPYQASLRYKTPNSHFCGATIIDSKHLITAAHCVVTEDNVVAPSNLMVVVGDLNILEESDSTEYRTLSDIFTHPDYDAKTFQNDIAVLRVSEAFEGWTQDIKAVEIAETSPPFYSSCIVSGWGSMNSPISPNEALRSASIPVIETRTCSEFYSESIRSGMFCAGFLDKGKDSCQGDSGGPLVCDNKLSGVVSWGQRCANEGLPEVYTDVATFRGWIEEQKARSDAQLIRLNLIVLLLSYVVYKLV